MRTGSVCTGYGGLDLAVHEVLGGELAWAADIDPGASAILSHRFPSVPNLGDISKTDWSAVEPVDVLTAGFPCQDVSCAGGRAGLREGNRTGVWAYVARAISELRPPLVVLENVRGLLSAGADSDLESCPWCVGEAGNEHPLRALGAVLGDLADLGYDARWTVASAADAGAPHRRERVFIVGRPAADTTDDVWRGRSRELPAQAGHATAGRDARIFGDAAKCGGRTATDADRRGEPWRSRSVPDRWREDAVSDGPGPAAGQSGGAATEDADGPVGCERRKPAPGQAPGGWPRADAGGSGGASAAADAERGGRDGRSPLQVRGQAERAPAPGDSRGTDISWGAYELAIRRWEHVTGRPAPRPTEPGRTGERLSPRFVEWMMGLPEGWVTDVPGLSRNVQLKALGNGVVPQQAAMALRLLLERSGLQRLVAADLTSAEGGEAA